MTTEAVAIPKRDWSLQLRRWAPGLVVLVFIGAIGYLTIVPLARLQYLALEHGGRAYREAYTRPGEWTTIRDTLYLGVGSLLIAVVLGTGLAWAATALPRRVRLLRAVPILPIVLPPLAAVLGWSFLLSPHPGYLNQLLRHLPWWSHQFEGPFNVYTMPWIIIITGLSLAAFVYLFVAAGLENISEELIEAGYVNGSGRAGVFFRVVLPLLRPALVYGTGVALLLGLGQFTAPLLLGANQGITVLTTDMYNQTQQIPPQYGLAAAIGSPLLLFGILVLVANRILLGNHSRFITHGGKGGFRSGDPRLVVGGDDDHPVRAVFTTVLPILALVVVSLSRYWSGVFDVHQFTLATWRTVTTASGVLPAIYNSIELSVIAAAVTLVIGYVAAFYLRRQRYHRIATPVLDFVVAMPLSIPAVIFGVGFLMTYTNKPFVLYGTKWVIVLVYITLMIPFATRMILSGLAALGDAYIEAARVSGAGVVRTHLQILAPLLRPTFGGALALMFILLSHEFAASLLVRAPTVNVMGTILYDYYENGGYPLVAVISLIMVGVTTAGVIVALILGGSESFKKL